MQKKKTELLKLLGEQCFFDYGDGDELNQGLREIAEYHLPEYLVKSNMLYMSLVHAFLYGAIMGIRHERKMHKEKANRAKGGAF